MGQQQTKLDIRNYLTNNKPINEELSNEVYLPKYNYQIQFIKDRCYSGTDEIIEASSLDPEKHKIYEWTPKNSFVDFDGISTPPGEADLVIPKGKGVCVIIYEPLRIYIKLYLDKSNKVEVANYGQGKNNCWNCSPEANYFEENFTRDLIVGYNVLFIRECDDLHNLEYISLIEPRDKDKEGIDTTHATHSLEEMTLVQLKDLALKQGIKQPDVGWSTCCPPTGVRADIIDALSKKGGAPVPHNFPEFVSSIHHYKPKKDSTEELQKLSV